MHLRVLQGTLPYFRLDLLEQDETDFACSTLMQPSFFHLHRTLSCAAAALHYYCSRISSFVIVIVKHSRKVYE